MFCVDTNAYAGCFERHLCAFVTGKIGDCTVGLAECEEFKKSGAELAADLVVCMFDEHGSYKPCSLQPTPGFFVVHGDVFKDGTPTEVIAGKIRRDLRSKASALRRHGRLEMSLRLEAIAATDKPVIVTNYAMQSVGINLSRRPSEPEIQLMKERSKLFVPYRRHPQLEIIGFRLVTQVATQEDEPI